MRIKRRRPSATTRHVQLIVGTVLLTVTLLQIINRGTYCSGDMVNLVVDIPKADPKSSEVATKAAVRRTSSSSLFTRGNIQPLSCPTFLTDEIDNTTEEEEHNKAYIRRTKTKFPFWISLHEKSFDKVRWVIWDAGYYYEKFLEKLWTNILLKEAPDGARIIDVGGNIGYYSLVSASVSDADQQRHRRFTVDAFEPNQKNQKRFCESVILNQWNQEYSATGTVVNIYPNGVSNESGIVPFREHKFNPGGGSFSLAKKARFFRKSRDKIYVTTLDEFARDKGFFVDESSNNKHPVVISILKVDVEGLEGEVLLGGKELFASHMVKNILIEVTPHQKSDILQQALNVLMKNGYVLSEYGGFAGPRNANKWPMDENLVQNMIAMKMKLNLWWKLKNE